MYQIQYIFYDQMVHLFFLQKETLKSKSVEQLVIIDYITSVVADNPLSYCYCQ